MAQRWLCREDHMVCKCVNEHDVFVSSQEIHNLVSALKEEGYERSYEAVSKRVYDYSHGTSFYTKMHSSIFVGDMMVMFINLYMNLYRMVTMYCWDKVSEDFDDVTDELDWILIDLSNAREQFMEIHN